MNISIPPGIPTSTPLDLTLAWAVLMSRVGVIKGFDTLALSLPPYTHEFSRRKTHIYAYGSHYYMGDTHVKLTSHKIYSDTLVLCSLPYKHQYYPRNTHIYAYGSHHYMGNTHDKLTSHEIFRHFGAMFTPYKH